MQIKTPMHPIIEANGPMTPVSRSVAARAYRCAIRANTSLALGSSAAAKREAEASIKEAITQRCI